MVSTLLDKFFKFYPRIDADLVPQIFADETSFIEFFISENLRLYYSAGFCG